MTQPLDRALTDLWLALEGLALPLAARAVKEVVFAALREPDQQTALAMGFDKLSGRSIKLQELMLWLTQPEIVAAAEQGGASWTLPIWHSAVASMLAGTAAPRAFNMTRRGRRVYSGVASSGRFRAAHHQLTFSLNDDLAAYVEFRVRTGVSAKKALSDMRLVVKDAPDDRTIRFARKKLAPLTTSDLAAMARVTCKKFGLP